MSKAAEMELQDIDRRADALEQVRAKAHEAIMAIIDHRREIEAVSGGSPAVEIQEREAAVALTEAVVVLRRLTRACESEKSILFARRFAIDNLAAPDDIAIPENWERVAVHEGYVLPPWARFSFAAHCHPNRIDGWCEAREKCGPVIAENLRSGIVVIVPKGAPHRV